MDSVNSVIEIINGVGFPITMAMALLWFNWETTKRYERLLKDFQTAIDNNTVAINALNAERTYNV